ncbi:MAG TPA: radical SAM protein [Aestuariivirga sp.]|nr:radical SAM protein [Aestuariivirga sp.]
MRVLTSINEHIYRKTGADFTHPTFIRCIVTERCNYKCQYCSHWRQERYTQEMSLEDWKRAIVSLKEFKHPLVVQFVGGEPFVWPHFIDLVEFCRSIDVNWGVITNGSVFTNEKIVKKIVAARPLNIDISVDSSKSEIHDKARGVDGSLVRIEAGMRLLVAARKQGKHWFPIRIKPTVHRLNASHLVEIVNWARRQGATSIDFSPVRLWRKEDIDALWVSTQEQQSSLKEQIDDVIKMQANGGPIETSKNKLESIPSHFAGEEVQHGAVKCRSALRDFLIHPNGDVIVCSCFPVVGNLREQSAKSIWKGTRAKQARQASLKCKTYTTGAIATSCTAHRSLWQDLRRATLLFGRFTKRCH